VAGSTGEAFSSEIWDWAYNQIPKVAAKYQDVEKAELEAQLAKDLLEIRRTSSATPRDWKAYLFKCLLNGASRFARNWRKRVELEPSWETVTSTLEPFGSAHQPREVENIDRTLKELQRRVSNADRRLLKQLRECDGNVSLLARRWGIHRNTIHRRLWKIRKIKCPIEIETAPVAAELLVRQEREQLAAIAQSPISSDRRLLRARVMLALFAGLTYNQIVRRLGTSRSTIARWRRRFTDHGIEGMKTRHRGRKPAARRARLLRYFRQPLSSQKASVRKLARQFGISKSTAHRLLKHVRDGALSRRKTL
jgi:transposase-like protein